MLDLYQITKKCDYCGEEIDFNVRRCPFCGSLLKVEKQQGLHNTERTGLKEKDTPEFHMDTLKTKELKGYKRENHGLEGYKPEEYKPKEFKTEEYKPKDYELNELELKEHEFEKLKLKDSELEEFMLEDSELEDSELEECRLKDYKLENDELDELDEMDGSSKDVDFVTIGKPYDREENAGDILNSAYKRIPYYREKDELYKNEYSLKPLSNGLKVFLSIILTAIPGFGQLIGIICSIVFMNSEEDPDKRSFGVALLIASSVMFILTSICFFITILALGSLKSYFNL